MIMNNKPLMIEASILDILDEMEWNEPEDFELTYSKQGKVAVIPIHGLLTKRSEAFAGLLGSVSYEEIQSAILEAQRDSEVSAILLSIDSPGGEVSGVFDLVDFIYTNRSIKPIYALADDSAFSAAYAIASATSRIFVNRTSGVGSIGVIASHVDISEANKKDGIKYTTIFAGAKKNDLSPNEPLSDAAALDLQKEVDRLYEMFVETVARNRGLTVEQVKDTQAGTYFGADAIAAGLADEIGNANEVLGKVLNLGGKMDIENYKTQVLEITQLCKLARAEGRIADFIEQDLTTEQVKEKLLEAMEAQHEITSVNCQRETAKENPVIAAAKKREAASRNMQ